MMTMAQHFLLSATARTLSIRAVYKAGEDKAYEPVQGNPLGLDGRHSCLPALRLSG